MHTFFINDGHSLFKVTGFFSRDAGIKFFSGCVSFELLENESFSLIDFLYLLVIPFKFNKFLPWTSHIRNHGSFEQKTTSQRIISSYILVDYRGQHQWGWDFFRAFIIRNIESFKDILFSIVGEILQAGSRHKPLFIDGFQEGFRRLQRV